MRCGYCYNIEVVKSNGTISFSEVCDFLDRRVGKLNGIVFSGGECTRNYLWIDYGNYGHPVNPELFSKKWNAAISNAVFEIDLFLLDFSILAC